MTTATPTLLTLAPRALVLLGALSACQQQTSLVGGGPGSSPDGGGPEVAATGGSGTGGSGAGGIGGTSPPMTGDASTDDQKTPSDLSPAVTPPSRVVFFYTPLGTVPDSWRPQVPDKGQFDLTGILAPLQPIKDRLLIVDGLNNLAHPGQPARATTDGAALLLTGAAGAAGAAGGVSLDVFLGLQWQTVAFPQLLLGVQTGDPVGRAISYGTDGVGLPSMNNPTQVWDRVFGGAAPGQAGTRPVVDAADFAGVGQAQVKLAVSALRAGVTRLVTLSWGDVDGATHFSWLPGVGGDDLRTLAAGSGVPGAARDQLVLIQTWFAQQFAALVGALAQTPEGTGSLLDHTLVVWLSESGDAARGDGTSIPVVMAGNMNGRFRNGAYVTATGSQVNLIATLIHVAADLAPLRADLPSTVGDPALGDAVLVDLLAKQ